MSKEKATLDSIMFIRSDQCALKGLLETLNNKAEAVIVVEGKNDEAALRRLLNAEFFVINNSNRSLYESAENIASCYREAMLMFDADEKGLQLTQKMKSYLQQNGVRVSSREGENLLKLARCRHVENLSKLHIQ